MNKAHSPDTVILGAEWCWWFQIKPYVIHCTALISKLFKTSKNLHFQQNHSIRLKYIMQLQFVGALNNLNAGVQRSSCLFSLSFWHLNQHLPFLDLTFWCVYLLITNNLSCRCQELYFGHKCFLVFVFFLSVFTSVWCWFSSCLFLPSSYCDCPGLFHLCLNPQCIPLFPVCQIVFVASSEWSDLFFCDLGFLPVPCQPSLLYSTYWFWLWVPVRIKEIACGF